MLTRTVNKSHLNTLVSSIGITTHHSKRHRADKFSLSQVGDHYHGPIDQINYRVANFSPGPSTIDLSVLEKAKKEFTNYKGTGISVFEMSLVDENSEVHNVMNNLTHRIGRLMNVPQNYQILFMHGGAHAQYGAVPLNICGLHNDEDRVAGYVNTGYTSQRAKSEADKFISTVDVCKSDGTCIPPVSDWKIPEKCAYIHLCANEKITGIEFLEDPELPPDAPPLIGDFSSTLFSRPVDIEKYGMIYASAGHNFGPSGFCIVIIKDELLEQCKQHQFSIPGVMSWNESADSSPVQSMYNTPAVFQLYMTDLIMQKIYGELFQLDIKKVHKWVQRRAKTIYKIIEDYPQLYRSVVDESCRSTMNIPFRIYDHEEKRFDTVLEWQFLQQAEEEWYLYQLAGDASAGGMRVNLYSGISDDSIKSVARFMRYFADDKTGNID